MGSTVIITIARTNSQVGFDPQSQPAAVGASVYWRNEDTEAHWPTPAPYAKDDAWLDYQIPGVVGGQPPAVSDGVSFGTAGTYDYVCALHQDETGTVVVS
jgi:plastocyanin